MDIKMVPQEPEASARKAFVLLSGGLDSTTCLYKAIHDYTPFQKETTELFIVDGLVDWVEAISISYGQRHTKELEVAATICARLGIKHTILDVGNLLSGKSVMLTKEGADAGMAIPDKSYAELPKGVSPTYVPFRNGLMLSAITAHAQKWVTETLATGMFEDVDPDTAGVHAGIYFGAHSEDAQNWAYPDCTPEFIGAMANAIYVGSYRTIRLHTPLQWLMKADIVKLGDSLGAPLSDTWSCYKGETYQCGTCPTCISRKEAFDIAGVVDNTSYQSSMTPWDPNSDECPF